MNPLFIRVLEILLVPYVYKEILWTIAPLVFALVMMQMYFGKYKTEQLGWNTAYGNIISLMWVTAMLFKFLQEAYGITRSWNTPTLRGYFVIAIGLGTITLILAILNFNHAISKKLAFLISSSLPINVLAYFALVIVMGKIPFDEKTFLAMIIIFTFLSIIFWAYKKIITPSKSSIPTLKKHEEIKKKEIRHIKYKIKKIFIKPPKRKRRKK
jgi:hypothetical protein